MSAHDESSEPSARSPWWLSALFVAIGLALWFGTQTLIGNRPLEGNGIIDMPLRWTEPVNRYLHESRAAADGLLIISSLIIDCLGIFLLARSIFGPSIRPFLGLLILFVLRQICQLMVALPEPPGMIWPDGTVRALPRLPELLGGFQFPTLLVTYKVANDFFFSGHTALAVYGAAELARFRRPWLMAVALLIALFQMAVVIVLRCHWTLDVFAGAVTALLVAQWAAWLAPYCDRGLAATVGWIKRALGWS